MKKPGRPPVPLYEPTAEQIEAECALIRESWGVHTWKRQRRKFGASDGRTYRIDATIEEPNID